MVQPFQALVRGAGPTGALAALALADAGWLVAISDPLDRARLLDRSRAYAFSHSSRRLLEYLGLWTQLEAVMVPFRHLELQDLGARAQVTFELPDLGRRLAQQPGAALGWIAQHGPLMEVLFDQLACHPAITLSLGSEAADLQAEPDLLVAADGPHSPTREGLGIGQWQWSYRQNCLSALVGLRGSEADQAWELLRPEGPFALLPLGGGKVQAVWSAPTARCRQLESLSDGGFLDALASALPDRFQPDALFDSPRAFPVAWQLAHRLHRGNCVLVGESGHRCHPVGGQGLNLCWRDVAELHRQARRVAAGRLRVQRLASAYALRRWPDLLLTLIATDLLVRLFSNRSNLLLPLRRLALAAMARLAPLRRLSLGAMTHGPCQLRW
ncbi:FAD-dependent monooxygenase [Cyanobium sp. WAJ14-Wanaka]|uniref:FAD-dependent monooxygenase n=1 Tax=Cyanobium sp. WAJ14-Wanaka TaxID=2823725 RepID=UPI0020CCFA08|nr:FAD-dependent monooxygenase [Cyanobium sp. WAJ14-Wanaka]MCP9774349.1 FAD-dependent monooxygenase [Cyanobium sp. WAJ14-Wanaka]